MLVTAYLSSVSQAHGLGASAASLALFQRLTFELVRAVKATSAYEVLP
jgi:hypothetical protein